MVLALLHNVEFAGLVFCPLFGPFFENRLADLFSGATLGFSGHRNHAFLSRVNRYHTHFYFFSQPCYPAAQSPGGTHSAAFASYKKCKFLTVTNFPRRFL